MDVAPEDLSKLLVDAEKYSFARLKGNISCADIMEKDILTVEYGTGLEQAWQMMSSKKLKAMPVVDKSQRVIGIISWADFFKFTDLSPYANSLDKFRHFIRHTPDVTDNKPEVVGHIMSSVVTTVPESTHIAELVALMSTHGFRQIPVVNQESRLVGMVYQANLITILYQQQLARLEKTA
jgi:CBS domain-containing membrane protein